MEKPLTSIRLLTPAVLLLLAFSISSAALAEEPLSAAREIRITAKQFEFQPKTITVRKGETVKLILKSEDVMHGFAIEDFGIDRRIPPGRETSLEITPNREGRFKFKCSVTCGDDHEKMFGQLIVVGADKPAIQVRFEQGSPGVVIVESGGERLRIDTAAQTVSRLTESENAGQPPAMTGPSDEPAQDTQVTVAEKYDYKLINVPTPKRVPRHSLNVNFTHRFSKPLHQENESFGDTFKELFGLDSFSTSSLGFSYGITDRLYASVNRSPICQPAALCKTIEIGLGYHVLDEAGRSPIGMNVYGSIEGADNFSEHFTYNIQGMFSRSITEYVHLFFSPAVHINTNGQGRHNPRPEIFGPLASQLELGQHTGSFGFGVHARIRPSAALLFEYTPRIGFKLGQIEPIFGPGFNLIALRNRSEAEIGFGIEKRIGRHSFSLNFSNTQSTTTGTYNSSNLGLSPKRVIIGFNLFRRLF